MPEWISIPANKDKVEVNTIGSKWARERGWNGYNKGYKDDKEAFELVDRFE